MSDLPKPPTAADLDSLRRAVAYGKENDHHTLIVRLSVLEALLAAEVEVRRLQAFKDWCHSYLDAHGVPHHPPGPHGAEGCRIGDRMDWLLARLAAVEAAQAREREREGIINE